MQKHADSHIDHGLTAAQIDYILTTFAARSEFFIAEIELPESLGRVPCALYGPTLGDDEIPERIVSYQTRGSRAWKSRTVDMPGRSVRTVTVIAGPHDGLPCVLFTAYGGPLAPQEPDDPACKDPAASRAFWSMHALASVATVVSDFPQYTRTPRSHLADHEVDHLKLAIKHCRQRLRDMGFPLLPEASTGVPYVDRVGDRAPMFQDRIRCACEALLFGELRVAFRFFTKIHEVDVAPDAASADAIRMVQGILERVLTDHEFSLRAEGTPDARRKFLISASKKCEGGHPWSHLINSCIAPGCSSPEAS